MKQDPWQIRSDRPLTEAYWAFMGLRDHYDGIERPALRWWMQESDDIGLNLTEVAIFDHIAPARRLLDVGAGDLRVKARFLQAGFQGEYDTVDTSTDVGHDFYALADVPSAGYDAVMALEVIEHISLDGFDEFIDGILRVLGAAACSC